ncbi:basic helix-loop-helix transcription factor scleraxis isoform X1 [Augochlora pura]
MAAQTKKESSKQRYQANARERDRTHRSANNTEEKQSILCSVNTAFSALRTLIPTEPADRKLSKIETLRLASSYISHLGAVLVAGPINQQPCLRMCDDGNGVFGANHWPDSQTRPQLCTFCLSIHKKYNLNVTSKVISDYHNHEESLYAVPATNSISPTYLDFTDL